MRFKVAESLCEVMLVRAIRNTCRLSLTNDNKHIGILHQARWYYRYYRRAQRTSDYRLYLLFDGRISPVGYGAARLKEERLFVTECVANKYRRIGYGGLILRRLIEIGVAENRDLVAEIWAANLPSVAMHEKAGFKLQSTSTKEGKELRRYQLAIGTDGPCPPPSVILEPTGEENA